MFGEGIFAGQVMSYQVQLDFVEIVVSDDHQHLGFLSWYANGLVAEPGFVKAACWPVPVLDSW